MTKKTKYLIIGIGITSMIAGVYAAIRSGELMESSSGVLIGIALIVTAITEGGKKDSSKEG